VGRKSRLASGVLAEMVFTLTFAATSARSQNVAAPSAPTPHHAAQSDHRKPVRLPAMMAAHQKRNMREHLIAVQEIVAALASNDWPRVEEAARQMGYTQQMGRMCNMMGAATPGFTPMALNFHHTADTIAAAAGKHNRQAVITALGNTLATCFPANGFPAPAAHDVQTACIAPRYAAPPLRGCWQTAALRRSHGSPGHTSPMRDTHRPAPRRNSLQSESQTGAVSRGLRQPGTSVCRSPAGRLCAPPECKLPAPAFWGRWD
jgi:hypothetical protein